MRLWLAIVLEILALSPAFSRDGPTKCQKAILNCCNPDTKLPLPLRCFEVNQCPGLYWTGRRVCSQSVYSQALLSISRVKVVPADVLKNTVDDEKNENIKVKKPVKRPTVATASVTSVLRKKDPFRNTFTKFNISCMKAIVFCCNPGTSKLPRRCFEVNKCPGLYWDGTPVCSAEKIKQARKRLQQALERRKV